MNCGNCGRVASNIAIFVISSVILFQVVPTILGYHAWVSMFNAPATLTCPALCPSLGLVAFGRRVSVRMRRPFGRRQASPQMILYMYVYVTNKIIYVTCIYVYIYIYIILIDSIYIYRYIYIYIRNQTKYINM